MSPTFVASLTHFCQMFTFTTWSTCYYVMCLPACSGRLDGGLMLLLVVSHIFHFTCSSFFLLSLMLLLLFLISHYCHFPFSLLFLLPFAFCCCRCDFLFILVYYDPRMHCFPPMMNYRHHHHRHCYCCYSAGVLYHSADSRANKAHVVSLAKEHDFH